MKKYVLSLVVIVTMFGLLSAAPFQTLGMLRTPDAYVLPHKAAEFSVVGYYRNVAGHDAGFHPYLMAGAGVFDRAEVGLFVGDKVKGEPLVYYLNMKLKILQETPALPQLSIGMDNILSAQNYARSQDLVAGDDFYNHPDKGAYEHYSLYLVASKQSVFIGVPWMFNAGFGTNRFIGQGRAARMFNGFFTSAEISPIKNLAIQGEFDGQDVNVGLKYGYKNWGFKAGMQAIEDRFKSNGLEDNIRLAFGVSYLLDKFSEAQRRPEVISYTRPGDLVAPVEKVEPGYQGSGSVVSTPGTTTSPSAGTTELSPEIRNLLEELRILREERTKAQKSLEDLRSWIQELKGQN